MNLIHAHPTDLQSRNPARSRRQPEVGKDDHLLRFVNTGIYEGWNASLPPWRHGCLADAVFMHESENSACHGLHGRFWAGAG